MKNLFFFLAVGLVESLKHFGKKRANPCACPTNNLKLSDTCECDDTATACEDTIEVEVAGDKMFTGATLEGKFFSVDAPIKNGGGWEIAGISGAIAVTDTAAIETWLANVLSSLEIDISVTVTYEDGKLNIRHIGCTALESIVTDGNTTNAVRCCDCQEVTKYVGQGVDEIPALSVGETSEALPNNPYEYAEDVATNLDTAAELQTDITAVLATLGIETVGDVTVTVNDISGAFDICFYSTTEEAVLIGVSEFQDCGKKEMFICESK